MERIKGANGELMKYSMQPMDGKGHLTLYRYDQLAVGGADNAHLEFWIEIEELRKQLADAQATIAALQAERDGWVRSREHYYQLWIRDIEERDEMRKERDDFESQLTQRTVERDTARRRVDELEAREVDVVTLREDLEQRTAELERVRLLSSHNERRFEEVDKKYKELREQNRVLREAAQQAMDLIHEDIVQGDKAGRRLKAEAILWNALTATSQPGGEG